MRDVYVPIDQCALLACDMIEHGLPASDPYRMSAATEAFAYGEYNLDDHLIQGGRKLYDSPVLMDKYLDTEEF